MCYDEAMERFGHDAPDLRFGMELIDIGDLAGQESEFKVFRGAVEAGGRVRGINAKGAADRYSRKGIDELTSYVVENFGAKGLVCFKVEADGKLASPIAKNFSPELLAEDRPSAWTPRPATCCCWWPTSSRPPARPSTACGSGWRPN